MSLFLETIKINNGRRINLEGHNKRMNHTRNRHFHEIRNLDLRGLLEVPSQYKKGIVKCRVVYGRKVESIGFSPYEFKNPINFQIVDADHINYDYKAEDRNELKALFDQRRNADDIIMVKNGKITDSYYANLAFERDGQWFTPQSPLLQGTQRTKLINQGKLIEIDINVDDIEHFDHFKIFNAMTEWTMCEAIEVSKIIQ